MIRARTIVPLLKGAATYIPGLYSPARGATGGTGDARYCYAVWMRHLSTLHAVGAPANFPIVAELGPGDSLGIGLAALLCGSQRLVALDVVRYASLARNISILHALHQLVRARAPVPDAVEFPDVMPKTSGGAFPSWVDAAGYLTDDYLAGRVATIDGALRGEESENSPVGYRVPWTDMSARPQAHVDLIFSQAVLEHVEDLPATYAAFARTITPGGWMSHVIDFRSHKLSPMWDGHLAYGRRTWAIVRGRRPFLLNRAAPSVHLELLQECGFDVLVTTVDRREPELPSRLLAREFRSWSALDRSIAGMHVIARRAVLAVKAGSTQP